VTKEFEDIHQTAKKRWRDKSEYRPENLISTFENDLDAWAKNNPR